MTRTERRRPAGWLGGVLAAAPVAGRRDAARPAGETPAFLALVCIAIMAAACRTAAPPVSPFGAGTEEIVAKSRELNQAFTMGDAAVAAKLLAPEYAFHWAAPNLHGKLMSTPNAPRGKWTAELFKRFRGGPLQWSTVDARVYGNLGVVVSYYRWTGAWDQQSFVYEGYVTDIWIRRAGRWQALESHASLLPTSF